jgi:hypothetical protein
VYEKVSENGQLSQKFSRRLFQKHFHEVIQKYLPKTILLFQNIPQKVNFSCHLLKKSSTLFLSQKRRFGRFLKNTYFQKTTFQGIQAGPADPTLNKFLELEPDVVSGRLQNAVIDCFSDGNDNRQCCRNKGVPK